MDRRSRCYEGSELTRSEEHARAPFEFNLFTLSTFLSTLPVCLYMNRWLSIIVIDGLSVVSVGLNNGLIICSEDIFTDKMLINFTKTGN